MNPIFGNDHHQFGLSFYEKSSNDDPNELNQKDKNYEQYIIMISAKTSKLEIATNLFLQSMLILKI